MNPELEFIYPEFLITNWIGIICGLILGIVLSYLAGKIKLPFTLRQGQPTAKEIGELLQKGDHIAILGKPGSGKSTYVQFLALTFAQAKARNRKFRRPRVIARRFGFKKWYLPIVIPLKKVSVYMRKTESIANLIFDAFRYEILPSEIRDDVTDEYIRYMLKKRKCIVLFDGLDEVANDEEFRMIVSEIKGLVSQFSGNKFIITSRHAGWRGGVGSTFLETEVNDLNENQINSFIDRWYDAILAKGETIKGQSFQQITARSKADKLKQTLRNTKNIRNLARNPLLLSMICFVHHNKTLPKERLSLYEDCSRLLLEQWDVEKGLSQDDIPLNYARKEVIMQEIAFSLHSGNSGVTSGKTESTGAEIIAIVKRKLASFNLDPNLAEPIFRKLVNRTGIILISEQYKDLYAFSHLTFQEFYSAKYLRDSDLEIFKTVTAIDNSLQATIGWWREVILLYSSMLKNPSSIIHQLCASPKDDLLDRKLQMAVRCYTEAIEPPSKEVKQALFGALLGIRVGDLHKGQSINLSQPLIDYLIEFSNSYKFYEIVINNATNNVKSSHETVKLTQDITDIIRSSSDFAVKSGAAEGMATLLSHNPEARGLIGDDLIVKFIDNSYSDVNLHFLDVILKNHPKPWTIGFCDKLIEAIVDPIIDPIHKNYHRAPSYFYSRYDHPLMMMMADSTFCPVYPKIKGKLISLLSKILLSPVDYRPKNTEYRRELQKEIQTCMALLLRLCSQDEARSYKEQLLIMLNCGDAMQQVWAMFLLSHIMPSDLEMIDKIIGKLNSPILKVRLSAIATLRNVELSPMDSGRVTEILSHATHQLTRIQRICKSTVEWVKGKGVLGYEKSEQIQIRGTLFTISDPKDFKLITDYVSPLYDSEKKLLRYKQEWIEFFTDLMNNSKINDLSRVALLREFKQKTSDDTLLGILSSAIDSPEEIESFFADELLSVLSDRDDSRMVLIIKKSTLEISKNSAEHNLLIKSLSKHFSLADTAFEILLKNNLL